MSIPTVSSSSLFPTEDVIQDCVAALNRVASYQLPAAMDRRLLWLSENKEQLSETEREELLALSDLAEERTVERVQALALLRRLTDPSTTLSTQAKTPSQ